MPKMSARSPARTSSPAEASGNAMSPTTRSSASTSPQAEEQLGTVVEPAADAVEHGGRVLAHHRPVGTVASEGNLAASRVRGTRRGEGPTFVHRGRLEDVAGGWSGYPDFLLPVDSPSAARHLPASRKRSSPEIGP